MRTVLVKIKQMYLSKLLVIISIVPPEAGGVQQAAKPKLQVTPVSDNSNCHHCTDSQGSHFFHVSISLCLLLKSLFASFLVVSLLQDKEGI